MTPQRVTDENGATLAVFGDPVDTVDDLGAQAAAALVAALADLHEVPKDGKVNAGQRRYTYLTLPDLLGEVRRVFAGHGLAVMQEVETVDAGVSVRTVILHATGARFESPALVLPSGRAPQDVGSAITYGRRYSLAAFVGLAGDDDDDGAAAQRGHREARYGEVDYSQRPVQRAQGRPDDPENAPWQSAPTPAQTPPSDAPVPLSAMPDASHRPPRKPTDKSVRAMWGLLRATGMDADQIRGWVAAVLPDVGPDWATDDLSQTQVSALIDRLKSEETTTP